jgi:hypothetical protein
MTITGSLSKGAGSFLIKHPDPAKQNKGLMLRHCFVESPTRGDNIYRFEARTVDGKGIIVLPDYFPFLNEDVQVWVSARESFARAFAKIDQDYNVIKIHSDSDALFDILVVGTRKDDDARNHFDAEGVEPRLPSEGTS